MNNVQQQILFCFLWLIYDFKKTEKKKKKAEEEEDDEKKKKNEKEEEEEEKKKKEEEEEEEGDKKLLRLTELHPGDVAAIAQVHVQPLTHPLRCHVDLQRFLRHHAAAQLVDPVRLPQADGQAEPCPRIRVPGYSASRTHALRVG